MRKTRKRVLSTLLAAVLALGLMPSFAFADEGSDAPGTGLLSTAKEPTASGANFFANGTPIIITAERPAEGASESLDGFTANGSSAYISWESGETKKYVGVNSSVVVWGGGDGSSEAVTVPSTSITMTGGTVYSILGGNLGQKNNTEDSCSTVEGNVGISVTGGSVTNLIYGGGENNTCVNGTVTINLSNASLGAGCYVNGGVLGHGPEGIRNIEDGTMTTFAVVKNVVISADNSSAFVIGGGGSGSTKVNSASVTLNNCTIGYLYASGINGEMETSSLVATGCTITEELAATNRGFIGTADVTLVDCNVKQLMTGATTGCFETDSGKPDGSGITGSIEWKIDDETQVEKPVFTPLAMRDASGTITATFNNLTIEKEGNPLQIAVDTFKPHTSAQVTNFQIPEDSTLTLRNVQAKVSAGQILTNMGTIDMDESSSLEAVEGSTFDQIGAITGNGSDNISGSGFNDSYVARIDSKGYETLERAVAELKNIPGTITLVKSYTLTGYTVTEDPFTIPDTATLAINDNVTLTVPRDETLKLLNPAFLDSKGSIKVQAGGTLKIPNDSGTTEAFVGANDDARIKLSSGDLTFDIGDSLLTLGESAIAEVPADKEAWLLKSTDGTTKTPLNAVIETGAKLTVNGTLNAISGNDQNGSTLTVKGELNAFSGTLAVAKYADVKVEDSGSVILNATALAPENMKGRATVLAGGAVAVGTEAWIGDGGNVVLATGSMTLDFGKFENSKIAAQIAGNTKASVPVDKEWTLKVDNANVDLTAAEGSTLDVAGKFKVASGSTLTLDGILNVSDTGCLIISSEGTVTGNGSVTNSGVLVLNKGTTGTGSLNAKVALRSGGEVYSQTDISSLLSGSSYREMSNKTYGGTAYAHAWEYYVAPTPAPTPTPEEFDVAVADVQNGAVELSAKTAKEGQKVTVTVTPDLGWELAQLTVADEDGDALELTENADGTYSFTMPAGDVTVHASFADAWENPFTDLSEDHWGYGAVRTANLLGLMKGIGGTTLFGPDDGLLREQAATVMWNLMGAGDVSRPEAPQADVDQSQWYAPYVNWAVDSKVMDGYSEDDFGVGDSLTREQFAAVVAKAVGADVDSADQAALGAFPDADGVSGWARATMAWAVEAGVLNGVGTEDGSRELQATRELTRAEMATMMVNAIEVGVLDFGA